MTVSIEFSEEVYSDDNGTGNLSTADFTVTNGSITGISGTSAPTTFVTLTINPLVAGTNVTVTVKAQSIFNAEGLAAQSESGSFVNP